MNTLLQKLQMTLNRFAVALAFPPLKVDGIVGKGTTEIALLVLAYIAENDKGVVGSSAGGLEAGINGPEQLTANAQVVIDTLTLATRSSAVASQVTAPAPLPPPAPEPTSTQIATTTANAPATSTNPAVQQKLATTKAAKPKLATSLLDKLPPWAAYASGAALILGTIGAVAYMRRGRSAPALAPAPAPAVSGWGGPRSSGRLNIKRRGMGN